MEDGGGATIAVEGSVGAAAGDAGRVPYVIAVGSAGGVAGLTVVGPVASETA